MTSPRRATLVLGGVLAIGLVAGAQRGHVAFAVVFAVAAGTAWTWGGFGPLFAVCVGTIALASGEYHQLKEAALDERWVALGTLAVWPVVSGRPPALPSSRLLLGALGAFLALAALSALWSVDQRLTVHRLGSFGLLLWVALVVVPSHAQTSGERHRLALSLAGLAVLGAGAAVLTGLFDFGHADQPGPAPGIRGWFENSNELGVWEMALAPCLLVVRSRRLAILGALLVATAILWSSSRSALFAMVALAIGLLPLPVWKRAAIGAGIVALAAALILTPAHTVLRNTALEKYSNPNPGLARTLTGARNEAWRVTVDHVQNRPVQGYGFGTGDRVFTITGAQSTFRYFVGASPSNAYLQALLELGIPGLLLLLIALAGGLRTAWRRDEASTRPFLLMGLVVLVIGLVESDLTSAGGPFALLGWSGLGVAMGTVAWREVEVPAALRSAAAWAMAPTPRLDHRQQAAIGSVVLAAFVVVAVLPVPRLHWLYRKAVRADGDGPDPIYSLPLNTAAMRRAAQLMPDDTTYYLNTGNPDALFRYTLRNAGNLFFTPAVAVSTPGKARWVLSYSARHIVPGKARARQVRRLAHGIYLVELRAS